MAVKIIAIAAKNPIDDFKFKKPIKNTQVKNYVEFFTTIIEPMKLLI